MSGTTRELDWTGVAPHLTGPYRATRPVQPIRFLVPSQPASGFRSGRIRSSDAWPETLPRIDRIAAVPIAGDPAPGARARSGSVVAELEVESGERLPLCARHEDRVEWNLDPVAWIRGILSESYVLRWKRPLTSRLPLLNYSRLPHALKGLVLGAQPAPSRQASNPIAFPSLPFDDLVETIRKLCLSLCWSSPIEDDPPWPSGCRAAITLAHDVDTAWILDPKRWPLFREIVDAETALGYRGAWYVTADRLDRSRHPRATEYLAGLGHEVGPHGWSHDSKLNYLTPSRQELRMQKIQERFGELRPSGIRTPWYCRSPQLFEVLSRHFAYDSSVPNSSSFFSSGCNSGCCTVFPYVAHGALYELPLTLPTDGFSDREAGYHDLRLIADAIIARGGVVVVTFHPQPHQSANAAGLEHYLSFLTDLASRHGEALWRATPRAIVSRYREKSGPGLP